MNDIIKKSRESLIEMKRLQIKRLELEIENIKTELKEPPKKSAFQEWNDNLLDYHVDGQRDIHTLQKILRKEGFNFALDHLLSLNIGLSQQAKQEIEKLKEP